MRKYSNHFYEPIRIEIAVSQIQHEFRKLFPSLSLDQWEKLDKDISEWFGGEKFELEEAHDFWNLFGGIARGLKLKSLLFWVTAKNVSWTKEEVPIDEVVITWDFPGFEFVGRAPYLAAEVANKLNKEEMSQVKKVINDDSDLRSGKYAPRDHFPIVLFHDKNGGVINKYSGYYVLEGNRRTARTIVKDKKKILSYVGRFVGENDFWPEDFWFRTGVLRDLIFLSDYYDKSKDDLGFRVVKDFYQLLLRDFELVRKATFDKTFKDFERNDRLLHDLFVEDLR